MKVLLVDDDALLRDMYVTKFTEAGHEAEAAESGERALARLKERAFDVVLLDMVMPGLTGLELLKSIHEMEQAKTTKCIVLSNQGEQADIESAKENGAIGYIIKAQMIPSEVVAKVEAVVAGAA
jgi:CheY-like chemotaxis protein